MSEALQVALLVAIGPMLVGIAQLIIAVSHAVKDRAEHSRVAADVKEIKSLVNGRLQ